MFIHTLFCEIKNERTKPCIATEWHLIYVDFSSILPSFGLCSLIRVPLFTWHKLPICLSLRQSQMRSPDDKLPFQKPDAMKTKKIRRC